MLVFFFVFFLFFWAEAAGEICSGRGGGEGFGGWSVFISLPHSRPSSHSPVCRIHSCLRDGMRGQEGTGGRPDRCGLSLPWRSWQRRISAADNATPDRLRIRRVHTAQLRTSSRAATGGVAGQPRRREGQCGWCSARRPSVVRAHAGPDAAAGGRRALQKPVCIAVRPARRHSLAAVAPAAGRPDLPAYARASQQHMQTNTSAAVLSAHDTAQCTRRTGRRSVGHAYPAGWHPLARAAGAGGTRQAWICAVYLDVQPPAP